MPTLIDRHPIAKLALARAEFRRKQAAGLVAAKAQAVPLGMVEWTEKYFYIPETQEPIVLFPHQKAILNKVCTRDPDTGLFPYQTIIYSTPKKSGKTTISGAVGRWAAETWGLYEHIFCVGNDKAQAQEKAFADIKESIELTPGYIRSKRLLPDKWRLLEDTLTCVENGSKVSAIATDYKGEAGSNPSLTIWTELWGFILKDALRMWAEMAPSPIRENSLRWVETYMGYEGESELLWGLYESAVKNGRQLTAADLGAVGAFEEAQNPDDLVPCWVNDAAGIFAYYDSGAIAHRMPWQRGEHGDRYYASEAATQTPSQMTRIHGNEWVSAESAFLPIELWDQCQGEPIPLLEGDKTPMVVGLDAATTKDCFGLVAVSRDPANHDNVAVRLARKWTPTPGHPIVFAAPGGPIEVIKWLAKNFNVVEFAYDPAQLEQTAMDLTREGVGWFRVFPQGQDRLYADNGLYDLIVHRRIRHDGDGDLREHITNANAKTGAVEDRQLRIVKKSEGRKIDLVIALSMSASEILRLNV